MSINSPIIAAGPSIQKVDAATTVCRVLVTDRPPPFAIIDSVDGILRLTESPPQWHGQMVVIKDPRLQYGLMYIAVEQAGLLEWKSVNLRYFVADKRTSKKKDPFDGLY